MARTTSPGFHRPVLCPATDEVRGSFHGVTPFLSWFGHGTIPRESPAARWRAGHYHGTMDLGKIARYTSTTAAMAALASSFFFVLRQRRRPTPLSPRLFFLVENPLTGAFVGAPLLVGRLGLTPGMKVLDAGCGPGRLTVPLAKAVGPGGRVVALDGQPAMLGKLEGRLQAEGVKNVRPLLGELGEGAPLGEGTPVGEEGGFDRAVLAMVLGEARDRAGALRELHGALRRGGVLSVTEIFGDPHHLGASTVLKEAEAAGFRLVGRFGSFPAYTLNFEKEPRSAALGRFDKAP